MRIGRNRGAKTWLSAVLLLAGCAPATPPQAAPAVVVIAAATPTAHAPTSPPAPAPGAVSAVAPPDCFRMRPKSTHAPGKQEVTERVLVGQSAMLHIDARRSGIVVPDHLAKDEKLVLQVGYAMAVPIPDLKVDAKGVSGTLSFNRQPFLVRVPWAAVYAVVGANDSRGWVWDEDVPEELRCP